MFGQFLKELEPGTLLVEMVSGTSAVENRMTDLLKDYNEITVVSNSFTAGN